MTDDDDTYVVYRRSIARNIYAAQCETAAKLRASGELVAAEAIMKDANAAWSNVPKTNAELREQCERASKAFANGVVDPSIPEANNIGKNIADFIIFRIKSAPNLNVANG